MRNLTMLLLIAAALPAGAATTNNDDSCDIAHLPAATLLLPYFEVDFQSPAQTAKTTIFTVQNVTNTPQIARVTLWTDWAFPAVTFNLFLTGYDVRPINLYDVFAHGSIASQTAPPGERSLANDANPHFLPSAASSCAGNPSVIPATTLADLQIAFTGGKTTSFCNSSQVGGVHFNAATGYATIDLVATCGVTSPADRAFYDEILFDNVLSGDYEIVNPNKATGNYAGGNPLVHIRAIPEGGNAGESRATNLPYTFYDRFTGSLRQRTFDRRQPLPSAFAARFIEGGTGAFNTELRMWREGLTNACGKYQDNATMTYGDVVRFDEHENPTVLVRRCFEICNPPTLPVLSSVPTSASLFFPAPYPSGDVGGWMYLNLDNGGSTAYTAARDGFARTSSIGPRGSQGWVVTSMVAEGRYAVGTDALALGNGCSPVPEVGFKAVIGPAPNRTP